MKVSFFEKIKNRQVWKSFVAYPAASFIILQAVDFFIVKYGWNQKLLTLTLILLIGGFIISVIWNWNHGEKGEQEFTKREISLYAVIAIITVVCSGYYWLNNDVIAESQSNNALQSFKKLAVLPFDNVTADASLVYLSDGIPENLINILSNSTNLRVLSRKSSFILEESNRTAKDVRKKLGADLMLTGRIEKQNEQLMVNCQLINVYEDTQIWGDKLFYKNDDVNALEESIVSSLLKTVPNVVKKEKKIKSLKSENPQAQAHYMKGRALSYGSTKEEAEKALEHFREAIAIDPKFVAAYIGIANEKIIQAIFSTATRNQIFNESRIAVQSALNIDPKYSEAYNVDGAIKFYGDFNWKGVEASFKKAIELDSLNSNALIRYSAFLGAMKQHEASITLANKAILIDPISISSLHNLGWVHLMARNFEKSEAAFSEALDIHPNWIWGYVKRGYAYAFQEKYDLAIQDIEKARELIGDWGSQLLETAIIEVYTLCHEKEMKNKLIKRFIEKFDSDNIIDPIAVSFTYFNKGDYETALDWIEKGVEEKAPGIYQINVDVFYNEAFLSHPRFIKIKKDLGF